MTIVVFLMLVGLLSLVLFLLLPIRICGSGRYEDGDAGFWGWVRPWGGLVGGRISYEDGQLRAGLMVLAWVPFSFALKSGKKEAHGADEPKGESDVEEAEPAEAPTGKSEQPEEASKPSLVERVAEVRALAGRIRLYARKMRKPVLRFLGRLLRVVRFRRVACRVVFGAPNPATTGKVYGYSLALQSVLGERADLHVEPDFVRTRLEGRLRLEAAVYLYRLVWAVACIAVRFAAAWLADVWTRWRRKRRTAVAPATS